MNLNSEEKHQEILKGYKEHYKCNCLECGYNGLMGVVGIAFKRNIIYSTLFGIGLSYLIYKSNWNIYLYLVAWATFFADIIFGSKKLHCPNCGKFIKTG